MKLVEIHWLDSMGAHSWREPDHLDTVDMTIHTIGWLVNETDSFYVVSASRCVENNDVYAPLKIPKCAVKGFWNIDLK